MATFFLEGQGLEIQGGYLMIKVLWKMFNIAVYCHMLEKYSCIADL